LPGASDLIEQLNVHARRYSIAPYRAFGTALKGELAIAREEPEAGLALQLPFLRISESMGNHDSKIVDADSVD
jgi:hypothetical protein